MEFLVRIAAFVPGSVVNYATRLWKASKQNLLHDQENIVAWGNLCSNLGLAFDISVTANFDLRKDK